jgi:hypothetical protein
MPFPIAGAITLAAAGVGAAALVVALVLPTPAPAGGTWVDFPTSGASVGQGLTSLTAHASEPTAQAPVTEFRFQLTDTANTAIPVMTDQHPVASGHPDTLIPTTLFYGRHLWEAVPGDYSLIEGYLAGGSWTYAPAVHFTVLGHGTAPTPTPTPTPTATATPSSTPTPTPTPSSSQAPNPPTPPTPPVTPAPTGQVQILSALGVSGYKDVSMQAYGITPLNAIVDIQVQLTTYGVAANPNGTWTSQGCSDLTPDTSSPPGNYACSAEDDAQDPFDQAASGWVRVQVTLGDQTITSYAPTSFTIQPAIH